MNTLRKNRFQALFISIIASFLVGVSPALGGDYINYRLLSGSTFTPKNGNQVTGPTEALTGTFQLHYEYHFPEVSGEVFKVTALHFESPSYMLNLTPDNTTGFLIKDNSNTALFYADVYTTGTSVSKGTMTDRSGSTYSGSPLSPTRLNYPAIDLYPFGGGYYYGLVSLYAQQIPEPATILFLGLGALAVAKRR
jgi:hypothetical protein